MLCWLKLGLSRAPGCLVEGELFLAFSFSSECSEWDLCLALAAFSLGQLVNVVVGLLHHLWELFPDILELPLLGSVDARHVLVNWVLSGGG